MMRLKMKNYNMILIENHKKYLIYHEAKLINMIILQARKCYLLTKVKS